ncbi:hypothetical protein CRG98_003155 [Punica granatum]|uniref:Uncharacterized protein n=1 Tax=Punica granatum TaxID=22663 RepID=A0A2I0L6U0_PUNGR|nr:hypothetical protein CRG98_003155 [Punica granatum]
MAESPNEPNFSLDPLDWMEEEFFNDTEEQCLEILKMIQRGEYGSSSSRPKKKRVNRSCIAAESNNDINILDWSLIFDDVLQGHVPEGMVYTLMGNIRQNNPLTTVREEGPICLLLPIPPLEERGKGGRLEAPPTGDLPPTGEAAGGEGSSCPLPSPRVKGGKRARSRSYRDPTQSEACIKVSATTMATNWERFERLKQSVEEIGAARPACRGHVVAAVWLSAHKSKAEDQDSGSEVEGSIRSFRSGHGMEKLRCVRMKFPRFSGEDLHILLDRTRQYFATQDVDKEEHVRLATFHLEGEDEKFALGHRCSGIKATVIKVVEEDKGKAVEETLTDKTEHISIHVLTRQVNHKIMRFGGQIGRQKVQVLVDNGASLNFIGSLVAKQLGLAETGQQPFAV